MEDNKIDLGSGDGMKMEKGKVAKWLENFFYHYKWHTLIALFLIVAITVCTFQMCRKESYDTYIMYAGSRDIRGSKKENDTELSEYTKVYKSLLEAVGDFNDDGKRTASFEALYMLSNDEIREIEEQLKESDEGLELTYSVLLENNKIFKERIIYGEYYVCLLSKSLYEAYKVVEGVTMFVPLSSFVEEGRSVSYLDDSAIYLNSLDFGKLPGLEEMPEDTVVVLRTKNAVSSKFNKKETEKLYERSKEVIRNIINYDY